MKILEVNRLSAVLENKEIIKDASIEVGEGEVVALIGPNGSGKSTLCNAIAGKAYEIKGSIMFEGKEMVGKGVDERAREGIFLVHQSIPLLEGIKVRTLLSWVSEIYGEGIIKKAEKNIEEVGLSRDVFEKDIASLSGGERKRLEMLLMLSFPSKLVLLDELDSGLDIDGLRAAISAIKRMKKEGKAVLVVSHYPFLLKELNPNRVYLIESGRITKQGGLEIIKDIEEKGYRGDDDGHQKNKG